MRFNIISTLSLVMALAAVSCTDDDLYLETKGDPSVDASPLRFEVDAFSVNTSGSSRSAEPSENPEPENEREKKIRDFWIFQFKPDGTQLASPAYYTTENGATLDALTTEAYSKLAKDTPMTIYVVTNTGSSTWATAAGFDTLDKVKEQKIPAPLPMRAGVDADNDGAVDDVFIPMSGAAENVTIPSTGSSIVIVPVTRMYAKLKIQANFPSPDMNIYYVDIEGIPWYCKVTTMAKELGANGEPAAAAFPAGTEMWSSALKSDDAVQDKAGNKWIVLYIPENIRGEIDNADKSTKQNIPDNALTVNIRAKHNGMDFYYTVYPGENNVNNFNIRRNCVYRVTVDVKNASDQHNPSSNCYVVHPGELLSFEPYNRIEKGGGYNISTYLNPEVADKTISRLAIIWQTKNCIGDNTNGDLVYLGPQTDNPLNRKIFVKAGEEGNALIGAYNSKGTIIWSWHIWVTPNEPDNLANAVVYTTYRWDKNGIYNTEPRVPGYGIMPCNIGALDFRAGDMPDYSIDPKLTFPDDQIRTFGMLYQFGRKDPFPPMIYSTGTEDSNGTLEYEDKYTGDHYANNNRTIVHKTSAYNATDYLFYSVLGGNQSNPVQYAIAHPTVYMSGNTTTSDGNSYNRKNGDWCGVNFYSDGLWGGTKGSGGYAIKEGRTTKAHLYNNYGEKSIFDPCPKGWRVPPGDLWLGFTSTGLNPTVEKSGSWNITSNYEKEVNYSQEETGHRPGMSMYVQAWRKGPTVYFPLQGTRIYNGKCSNPGLCGNYHNATCDDGGRVNILHLHRNMDTVSTWTGDTNGNILFKIFEYEHPQYYSKSTAGPIRCVRDSK